MTKEKTYILLVEDDEDDYIIFKSLLQKLHDPLIELHWEHTYAKAISRLKSEEKFDVCFVDYRLGAQNGLDFIKEAKRKRIHQAIIMLTGQGNEELGIEAVRTGAEDYYIKTDLTPQSLKRAIRFTLERKHARLREDALLREQTERKLAEEQRAYLTTLLEASTEGIFGMDMSARCTFINSAALNLLGYKEEECLGKDIHSLIHYKHKDGSKYPRDECPINKVLVTGESVRLIDETVWNKKKNPLTVLYSCSPITINDTIIGGVTTIVDMTEHKRLENLKDEFMGIVSHELKTPVTSIKAFAQVLKHKFFEKGDAYSASLLEKMDIQINKLTSLIGDLLDITKIEGGKLQFNEDNFNFDELTDEIIEEVQRTTTEHTLVKIGKVKKSVFGDRDRIGQVLINLLTNAIKYSPKSQKVIIKIEHDTTSIKTSVTDFGIGIPKEKQKYLFKRFYRVDTPRHSTMPGIGLGLYISNEIIKRQGGTIRIESEEGKGSTFSFTIPVR